MNIFTTHSDDNCSSQRGHARWFPDEENQFIETLVSDVTKLDEISLLLSEDSNDPKERINTVVDKIGDIFKSTANRVFKPKRRFYPSGSSNQLWSNKKCRDKRKVLHKAKNRYSFNKNKENRDEMKKSGKAYRTEMNKSLKSFQHALESDMRKLSKKDSGKFWKILKRFDRGGSDKDIQITIDQLYEYFKSLNESDVPDDNIDYEELTNSIKSQGVIEIIDQDITEDEILSAVKKLCNGKAPGGDEIVNEYIKSTVNQFLPIYTKLFNLVFDSGIVPNSWLNTNKPLFKSKGDPNNLDNYRAICLTSNLGKVFTSILNSRLNALSDEIGIITDAQGGFRKGYSVQDSMFVMHALISLYLSSGKKLFCAFVDFGKAFDTVWRVGLWQKLLKYNIGGKMFKVILSMYTDIKSCVKNGELKTDFSRVR